MEARAFVTMELGQYAGMDIEMPKSEAENLVMTGQARWTNRPLPKAETPEGGHEFADMTRKELEAYAAEHDIEVTRADGEDLPPLKSDYLRVLG